MFNSSELSDELQTLKSEVVLLLNSEGDGVFDAAKGRADAIADQIKAALNELGGLDVVIVMRGHLGGQAIDLRIARIDFQNVGDLGVEIVVPVLQERDCRVDRSRCPCGR